ncbi:MAG: RagB/SusD family nutrient uptake outer membrane protein [Tannerellaceae bacterium]|nr:RagB/SusD family nutrient uptake outer membrane protein [Tannerellaceae bacterium]
MKQYKFSYLVLFCVVAILTFTRCNLDPEYYSQTVPETFYDNEENVWQRFFRPFTHWRWYVAQDQNRWNLQELGTDEFCYPYRASDWVNGGENYNFHLHRFDPQSIGIYEGWRLFAMGVALAWDALEDLDEFVDFDAMGFSEGTKESMLNQQKALIASFYLDGLDLFGGVPLYTTTNSEILPRSTAEETFKFIEDLLLEAIPNLPLKTELGALENGGINRAAGAALLARLYFNANVYIGKEMFTETAKICEDIINGVYGSYELDARFQDTFGFNNEYSKEIIWTVPSANTKLETNGFYSHSLHYNSQYYFGNIEISDNHNGVCLQPSRKPNGQLYSEYKLGSPYEKFEDNDVRKKPYVYLGNGEYEGMFLVGEQVNPITGGICYGAREYRDTGKPLEIVDQIAYMSQIGTEYTVENVPNGYQYGEENSGVRLHKRSVLPNAEDKARQWDPDVPFIRLTEIYYTLAECEMRADNTQKAAELINTVRKRYFVDGDTDPNPVVPATLDKYRMLDEWLIEFLGEGRRRTDLVRWNAYVTEAWWDHTPTNDPNKNRFPLSERTMAGNNLLEQNPGYK